MNICHLFAMSTSTATTTHHPEGSVLLAGDQQIVSAADDTKFQSIARGNRNGTLKLRGIPEFSDSLEKRKWMKEHMAAAFRYFGKLGYGEGISGHISMRGMPRKLFKYIARKLMPYRSCPQGPFLDESLRQALFNY